MEESAHEVENRPQLFRAYNAEDKGPSKAQNQAQNQDWLRNPSFNYDNVANLQHQRPEGSDTSDISEAEDKPVGPINDVRVPPAAKRKHDTTDDEDSAADEPAAVSKSKTKKTKKEKKKKKHKKHKKHRHYKQDEVEVARKEQVEKLINAQPTGKVFIDDLHNILPEDAYRLDRTPDPNNLAYQSIYNMHIAKYHRAFSSVLGLTANQRVSFSKGKQKRDKDVCRYHSKENVGKRKDDSDKEEIVIDMSDNLHHTHSGFSVQYTTREQYIPINELSEREETSKSAPIHGQAYNPLGIYDSSTAMYIQGKTTAEASTDGHSKVKYKDTVYQKIQRQTAEFNKHLNNNPNDVQKWIQFVNFQDEALLAKDKDTSHAEKKGRINQVLLDIKLSIIEKALEKNPASIDLKKIQLLLGAEIWESSKLAKEWKQLTFKHPNNPDVWWHYLLFLQSKLNAFSVSTVVKAYGKCLSTFDSIRSGTLQSHGELHHVEEHMIYVFNLLAKFLKQTGHMERALSLYQAMIEFNIFCPDVLKQADRKEKFDFLEAFWDSAVPRFGENGAKGWGHWVQSKGEVPFMSMYDADIDEVIEEKILSCDNDRSETWLNLEKSRMSRHWLPWRPNVRDGETEEDCEDPERLIMFDDISSLIFEVKSIDNKLALIISLLSLIGIDQDKMESSKFPSQSVLSQMIQQYELESFCDINVGRVLDDAHLVCCCSDVEINREDLSKFSENVLHQATQQFDGHYRTRLTLLSINLRAVRMKSMEDELKKDKKLWKNSCKELKRWIKDILKEEANRNNILLWEAYAEAEEMLGNKDDSLNVLDTVLSMNILPGGILKVKDSTTLCQICKLCRDRVENEMGIHKPRQSKGGNINRERILHVLSSLADNEQYSPLKNNSTVPPTKVLRARRNYQSLVDKLQENEEDDTSMIVNVLPEAGSSLAHTVVCYAYFQYLTVDVHAASVVFQQCVASVKSKHQRSRQGESGKGSSYFDVTQLHWQKVLEKLTEAHISLLEYHIDVEVSAMRILRIPLQQALHEYPDNVQLFMAYANLESRGGIRGQLRRKLHTVAKLSSTPAVWLSAIIAELQSIHRLKDHHSYMVENYKMLSGFSKELIVEPSTKHQLRAWFEKALDQSPNRHCILLWRLYMYTETEFGEKFAAKAVFYRAVQQCPRAKAIYMDFVHYFPDKLQEVVDLLVEKELRVRMPLEELDLLLANKENIIANQTDDRDKQEDVVQ